MLRKKWPGHEIRGFRRGAGRESMVGKICEIGRMRPISLTPRTEKHICHSYTSELYNTVVLLYTSPSS